MTSDGQGTWAVAAGWRRRGRRGLCVAAALSRGCGGLQQRGPGAESSVAGVVTVQARALLAGAAGAMGRVAVGSCDAWAGTARVVRSAGCPSWSVV